MDNFFKFLKDNKDALGWLFGSGVVLALLGGFYRLIVWLFKEYRLRKIRTNDNFPFKIIPPNSNVAKEILGGADDDPLADRNIPYQQRIQGRNIRRELEELIEDNRWILIAGRTGLGKTREAVQVAQSLNNEGWTILYLTREVWLDAPAKLPLNVPERKILFFLDGLNKKCYSSKAEIRPNANESLTLPIAEPFQTRLQRTLETFDTFCGKGEIRVIATARNEKTSEFDEPSEWEKLGWANYNEIWKNFKLIELSEPDKTAQEKLLKEASSKANILIEPNELEIFAYRNDGTFRNLVENLSSAKTEGDILSSENFRDTLKGTWQKRYQNAIQKYSGSIYIYDAIELIRDVGIQLSFNTVVQVAKIVSEENLFQRVKLRRKYSQTLKQLIRIENLLQPRDGQIEAKGYKISVQKYSESLYYQILEEFISNQNIFVRLTNYLSIPLIPKSYFLKKRLSLFQHIYSMLMVGGVETTLANVATAYRVHNFVPQAIALYEKSLELSRFGVMRFAPGATAIQWDGLGNIYYDLGQYEEAILAYKKAIKFNKKEYRSWSNLGITYLAIQKIDDAIKAFTKSVEIAPKYSYATLSLAVCLRKIGNDFEAEKHLNFVEPFIKKEKEYFQACYHVSKGNMNEGLHFLKEALDKQQTSKAWARRDPNFENLHDEPQFKKLMGM